MRITRDNVPLNLIVYLDFRLRMLGFSEWLEVHTLASKKTRKSYDLLLQSLKAKFQWVLNQAKRLGLPPPPELETFRLAVEDKKKKRSEIIKEVFLNENIRIPGMGKNLTLSPGVVAIKGKRTSPEAEDLYKRLLLTIEARNDVEEAERIVKGNLDDGAM
ncbi:hypothetical protein Tco_1095886 [Tanacetum coccineum]